MSRPQGSFKTPSYRLHRPSGRAVVTLNGRDIGLGKYDSAESKAKYKKLIGAWLLRGKLAVTEADAAAGFVTVLQVTAGYLEHAKDYYPRGIPPRVITAIKWLVDEYGDLSALEFGPLKLKSLRENMIRSKCMLNISRRSKGGVPVEDQKFRALSRTLCRSYINALINKVQKVFKWAASVELVPGSIYHALVAVEPLAKGHCAARESDEVKPVEQKYIDAVLAVASRTIAGMIRLQLLTGMRPGELVSLRGIDIDMSDSKVWKYQPQHHKTEHRGHQRIIHFGPQAQDIVREFMTTDLKAHLFNPRRECVERYENLRFKSKRPNRPPKTFHPCYGDAYSVATYRKCIARYCRVADRKAHQQRPDVPASTIIIPRWHPHQLRHAAATDLRDKFDLDTVQAILGHASRASTERYARPAVQKGADAMAAVG